MKTVIPRCRSRTLFERTAEFPPEKRPGRRQNCDRGVTYSGYLRFVQQMLTDAKHVACADGEDNVTGTGGFRQVGFDLRKGRIEFRPRNLLRQISGRDADGILLTRSIDLREIRNRRTAELLHKVVKQRSGPAVRVRLEHNDRALIIERLDRVEDLRAAAGV